MTHPQLTADLRRAAEEELARATTIPWARLVAAMPWGDTFEGFTPAGRAVCFERTYLWQGPVGGEIRLEVTVYEAKDYENGVKLTQVISPEQT